MPIHAVSEFKLVTLPFTFLLIPIYHLSQDPNKIQNDILLMVGGPRAVWTFVKLNYASHRLLHAIFLLYCG